MRAGHGTRERGQGTRAAVKDRARGQRIRARHEGTRKQGYEGTGYKGARAQGHDGRTQGAGHEDRALFYLNLILIQ